MSTTVLALSRCLSNGQKKGHLHEYRFHFKGAFMGHSIVEINVIVNDNKVSFIKGEDYLLKLRVFGVNSAKLRTQLIESKRI